MILPRRAGAALAVLAAGTALLLTGCSPGAHAQPAARQPSSAADRAQLDDMRQKMDAAESAAAEADADATQNN
ncbi:hypothetical protein [Streptomyces sp. G-G2]|uniref:hypothetical protein n=1 Tax=Streptomyces sp. G-G2 TaxID=3046201 RepID=UPI0024BB8845|nr:hypothetical protein [Streptomyces sp. G-G2]MDJ0385166.1 hypothetical protein [Streptomyces sp. G-G2]